MLEENISSNNKKKLEETKENKNSFTGEDNYLNLVLQKLDILWGEDLDQNLLLVKRAFNWLGISENLDSSVVDEISFLNKMVDLGKILSEDNIISTNQQDFSLSPSEAKKIRLKMTSQKEVLDALNNKSNIRHKEVLSHINRLNEIIAKEKY